jgi:Rrf2 family protein
MDLSARQRALVVRSFWGAAWGNGRGYMKISTKGRYALRLMLDLAQHNTGEYISLKDISGRQDITVKYLEQIVTSLTRAGFLRSQRGNNGGYRLAKNPAEYKVGDILRAMEGSLDPVNCDASVEDIRNEDFAVLPFWRGLSEVINKYVDSYTLEDLVDMAAEMAINTYMI